MHRFIMIIFILYMAMSIHAIDGNIDYPEKMNAPLRSILRRTDSEIAGMAEKGVSPAGVIKSENRIILNVFIKTRLSSQKLREKGIDITSNSGNLYTARIPLDKIDAVIGEKGIDRISLSTKNHFMLDVSTANTGDQFSRLGCNAAAARDQGINGTDIIIGIVDSGIDWDHGDFLKDPDSNNQSRVLYLWDQNLSPESGESNPDLPDFDYGVEYEQNDINDELDGLTSGYVRSFDTAGHGTHVAGIAAGDGSASDGDPPPPTYIGVANNADLIIVNSSLYTTDIVDGVDYIFQRADELGKSAVVNLSLGTFYGSHDGTSPYESMLSHMTGPGKLIVVSAGNANGKAVHAEDIIPSGGTSSTTFDVPASPSVDQIWIDAWVDGGDTYNVKVFSPTNETGVQIPGGVNTWKLSGEG